MDMVQIEQEIRKKEKERDSLRETVRGMRARLQELTRDIVRLRRRLSMEQKRSKTAGRSMDEVDRTLADVVERCLWNGRL